MRLYRFRPNLYLPEKSITHLFSFIIGVLWALSVTKLDSKFEETDNVFRDFAEFLGISRGMFVNHNYTFASHFLEQSNGNEERAFDLFYAAFEEFLLEKEDLNNE